MRRAICRPLCLVVIAVGFAHPALKARAEDKATAAPPAAARDTTTALEAGARFGQALGAIEVCYGSSLTEKAKTLEGGYAGAELEAFKAQAAKILAAWRKVKGCVNQYDPNQCKIIMDKSCLAAEAEIGAAGSALPGLVEFAKHN